MKYLSACCVFKDETRYIREWVEYHLLVGFERLYLVSNDASPDGALDVLLPYRQSGLVFLAHRPGGGFVQRQMSIYAEILRIAKGETRWLAFMDMDEFLLPVTAPSVPDVLAGYEQHAAIAVNWACFGSSGFREPQPLQTVAYRTRLKDEHDENRQYKSILDPARVAATHTPHRFQLHEPWVLVDEFGQHVDHPSRNPNNPFFGAQIRMNHYRLRSAEEFRAKVARWQNQGHPEFRGQGAVRLYWERNNECPIVDDTIHRFVPELQRRLADRA